MGTDDRDRSLLEKMLTYCRQIEEAHAQFGRDRAAFYFLFSICRSAFSVSRKIHP
jgi:hypothetical protein